MYFCGSIRGGRERAQLYSAMIAVMKKYGTVLTEHIGDVALKESGTDRYIWQRDTDWLRECDLVIAECTVTSLGVGYEIGLAESLGKKICVFYGGEEGRLSAMLSGNPNIQTCCYRTDSECLEALKAVLDQNANL